VCERGVFDGGQARLSKERAWYKKILQYHIASFVPLLKNSAIFLFKLFVKQSIPLARLVER
jgi:hypothetical protein